MDVTGLEPGDDFVEVITSRVASCDVLIAVIGKGRCDAADERGNRRLDDPNDFVRIEITTALQRRIRVIPALVGGASMPQPRDLPEALSPLATKVALEISGSNFDESIRRLITSVKSAFSSRRTKTAGPIPVETRAQF